MNLLAIDTSSDACSVAIMVGEEVFEQHVVEPRQHTRILVPMIRDALQSAGLGIRDLDAVVLGNGPGSFIGMRIGASVAQGICHAAGINIVPVSSLAAVAAEVFQARDGARIIVAQDARMNEVYVGYFRRGPQNSPISVAAERIVPIGEIDGIVEDTVAVGGAWNLHDELTQANARLLEIDGSFKQPRARFLLLQGAIAHRNSRSISPQHLVPAYLRDSVASAGS